MDKVIRLNVIHHLNSNICYPYKALYTLDNTMCLCKVVLFLKLDTAMKHGSVQRFVHKNV